MSFKRTSKRGLPFCACINHCFLVTVRWVLTKVVFKQLLWGASRGGKDDGSSQLAPGTAPVSHPGRYGPLFMFGRD